MCDSKTRVVNPHIGIDYHTVEPHTQNIAIAMQHGKTWEVEELWSVLPGYTIHHAMVIKDIVYILSIVE